MEKVNVSIDLAEDGIYELNDDAEEDKRFRGKTRIDISIAAFDEYLDVGRRFSEMQQRLKMLYNDVVERDKREVK